MLTHQQIADHLRLERSTVSRLVDRLDIDYPKFGRVIDTPFVAIELSELEPGHDDGTGRVPPVGRMQARVIIDPLVEDADVQVRELSARVLQKVYGSTHEICGSDLDQYRCLGRD